MVAEDLIDLRRRLDILIALTLCQLEHRTTQVTLSKFSAASILSLGKSR